MADRILVLREGRVQQIGPPEEIYHRPANRFVATVVGSPPMNFLPAVASWSDTTLRVSHPLFEVSAVAAGAKERLPEGAACWIGVRPEDVHIDQSGVPAKVYVTEPLGGETVVDLELADRVVKVLAPPTLQVASDQQVLLTFDPQRLHVFTEAGDAVLSAAGAELFRVSVR